MLTHDEAVALFDRRRDAWLREDLAAYLAVWAEDMTFESPVHAQPVHGRAAFAAIVHQSAAMVRPVSFDFEHLAVQGSMVLAEWRIVIERRDTGRRIAWRGMSVAEIRDGRIVHWREYRNPAALLSVD
jgi:limonene-1,2-epoxide hydrolase